MSAWLARYRKGIIAGIGVALTYGSQVLPLLHGQAAVLVGAALALLTTLATVLSPPNAPAAQQAPASTQPAASSGNTATGNVTVYRSRPDVPVTYGQEHSGQYAVGGTELRDGEINT